MVQRKAVDKLGIQADSKDSVKSEERAMAFKPASPQHQDIRNKGGSELKKKKKMKSRSIELLDLDLLGSSPMRQAKLQLDETPANISAAAAAITQKLPPMTPSVSPNYMKPTSSSDARREHLQVSPPSASYSKSSSVYKPRRTSTKTFRLRPVRTLMRPLINKNPGVALYPNLKAGRATCSSTLKDHKFPASVLLQPGGTESEGFSVFKVCPYTYCSLNGHHHTPLPPLKPFLSAKRRILRTQKNMRMKGLSPLAAKPSGEKKKEIDTGQIIPNGDPAIQETDSSSSPISSLIEEVGMDFFFLEIYAKTREDTAESTGRSIHERDDKEISDFPVNPEILDDILPYRDCAETELGNDDVKYAESLPDESLYSEISFEDALDKNGDFLVAEMDIQIITPDQDQQVEFKDDKNVPCLIQAETGPKWHCIESNSEADQQVEVDEDSLGCLIQAETALKCRGVESELKGTSPAKTKLGESVPEATAMDWEDRQVYAPHLDDGIDDSTFTDDECELTTVYLPKFKDPRLHNELVSDYSEEVPVDEVMQEVYEGNTGSCHSRVKTLEIDISRDITGEGSDSDNSLKQGQLSSTDDAFEQSAEINDENDGDFEPDDKFINTMGSSAPAEDPLENQAVNGEGNGEPVNNFVQGYPLPGDNNPNCTVDVAYKTLIDEQEKESLRGDPEMDPGVAREDPDIEAKPPLHEVEDEGYLFKGQSCDFVDSKNDQDAATGNLVPEQELPNVVVGDEVKEKEHVDNATAMLGIQIFDSCEVFFETDQDRGEEYQDSSHQNIEVCHCNVIVENNMSQEVIDEGVSPQTQSHSTGDQLNTINIIEQENESLRGDPEMDQSVALEDLDIEAETRRLLHEIEDEGCLFKGQICDFVESKKDQDTVTGSLVPEQELPSFDASDEVKEKEQVDNATGMLGIQISDSCEVLLETDQERSKKYQDSSHQNIEVQQCNVMIENNIGQDVIDEDLSQQSQGHSSGDQSDISTLIEQKNEYLKGEPEMDQGMALEDQNVEAGARHLLHEIEDEGCLLKGQLHDFVDSKEDQDAATGYSVPEKELPSVDVGDEVKEREQVDNVSGILGNQIFDSCDRLLEIDQDRNKEFQESSHQNIEVCQCNCDAIIENIMDQEVIDEGLSPQTQGHSSGNRSDIINIIEHQGLAEKDQAKDRDQGLPCSTDYEEYSDLQGNKRNSTAESIAGNGKMEEKDSMELDAAETCLMANKSRSLEENQSVTNVENNSNQLLKNCSNLKGRCERHIKGLEKPRKFNPREPRYLPLEPEPEAEKIDLRHQMMDERKNDEEWMLDYALQKAVTKLAPASKKRVALLVEAFETVMPLPKCETHLQHATPAFAHARPIQACR